jgi:diguanylate cyclase (GGDEF)-like protein
MLDIDGFKKINDRLGHAAGDAVLQSLAEWFGLVLHQGEILTRIGGDEFVVLVPHTDNANAEETADLMRQRMAEKPTQTFTGPLNISISGGVAALIPNEPDITAALDRADQALFIAKQNGRNRISVTSSDARIDQAA